MKKIKIIFPFFILIVVFWSCKKEENVITYEGGTAPVLTSSVATGDTIVFNTQDTTTQALALSWTNPNYQLSNGPSSLNVNYAIQVDTLGANFGSSLLQNVTIVSSLNQTFSVGQLNAILNAMPLSVDTFHTIQIRVESYLGTNGAALYSNVFNYTVMPFPVTKVQLPPTGTLFIVGGDPLLGGWSNSVPANQQFTRNSATDFSIVVTLSGGDPTQSSNQFSVTNKNGTWDGQYGVPGANLTSIYSSTGIYNLNGVDGSGTNFPGPVAPGTYKIDLNFQTGTYTETLQ